MFTYPDYMNAEDIAEFEAEYQAIREIEDNIHWDTQVSAMDDMLEVSETL